MFGDRDLCLRLGGAAVATLGLCFLVIALLGNDPARFEPLALLGIFPLVGIGTMLALARRDYIVLDPAAGTLAHRAARLPGLGRVVAEVPLDRIIAVRADAYRDDDNSYDELIVVLDDGSTWKPAMALGRESSEVVAAVEGALGERAGR